jgi:hypothetical protein
MRPPASPSCRLYPPACKPYGLEAEPEAVGAIGAYAPEGRRERRKLGR